MYTRKLAPTLSAVLFALALVLTSSTSVAQIQSTLVKGGFSKPLWAGAPEGDERIFVLERDGLFKVVKNGTTLATPFLDLSAKVSTAGEQGLLGAAFHPDYANNGYVFLYYTDLAGDTVVARFTRDAADADKLDASTETLVLTVAQPSNRHNAGCLQFDLNGYLMIAIGDGSIGADPDCNAQKLSSLLGKILRIDVDPLPYTIPPDNPFVGVGGAMEEIYHFGLRNPWRFSIDAVTGDLFIGDVGENNREEINFSAATTSGLNFGWKVMEGTFCKFTLNCVSPAPCGDPSYTDPIHETVHGAGSQSITGGYVYRGCALPGEVGKYFFADYADDKITSFEYDSGTGIVSNFTDRTTELDPGGGLVIENIASLGTDGFGELLLVENSAFGGGEVYRIDPAGAPVAASSFMNGSGSNAACYVNVEKPVLGRQWTAEIDTSGHPGATFSIIAFFENSTSGIFRKQGELLVTGPKLFTMLKASTGGIDVFSQDVPCDPAFHGAIAYSQGAILGGAGAEFCNAAMLTVGHF